MSRGLLFLFFGLLVLGIVSGSGENVSVVILSENIKDVGGFSVDSEDIEMEITHKYSSIEGFAVNVDADDLDEVKKKFGEAAVVENREFSVSLDVSVSKIGANESWNLKSGGANLTGAGQTICIIDTGVNYNHPALGGCYGNDDPDSSCKILGGYDYVNGDSDPMDDHGHGTHVAGIAVSNDSTYTGVARDSKIIAMKVLNDQGKSESGADVLAAIDWCIANASKFNISVISMSFGDNSTYNSYCDAESLSWRSIINSAVGSGIAVVVSAGNCNEPGQTSCTTGVSFPACIENATRVGAVDDSDVVDYMRGALFELLAPGVNIVSANYLGGTTSKSGTSMSAPHVSGAIALIKQHLLLSSQSKTIDEIEEVLNSSGVRIDDSGGSGYNFTRINVYDALLSLDNSAPNVLLVSPANDHVNLSVNQSFSCSASDWQLENVTFRVWNSSGILYNESFENLSGAENGSVFSLENMSKGDYEWNCFASDSLGNFDGALSNFSFTIGEIEVSLDSPLNGSYVNVNETNFSCSARSDSSYGLTNISFYLWNSTGSLMKNESRNISGFENVSNFSYSFLVDDSYLWECVAYNNNSDIANGVNFSVVYDSSAPVISGLNVDASVDSAVISWTTNEPANSSVLLNAGSWSNSSAMVLSHSVSVSGLDASTSYNYYVSSCDLVNNCRNSSGNFVTDDVVSSGGGGGGGSSVRVIDVKDEELWNGKFESLGVGDSINFGLASGKHSLKVSGVGVDFVDIVIASEPVYLTLKTGEEVKLNLSSPGYYDLVVGLNGVLNRRANVSVMRIFEEIVSEEVVEEVNESEESRVFRVTDEEEGDGWIVGFIALAVFVLIVGAILGNRKEVKAKRAVKRRKKHEMKKVLKHLKAHSGHPKRFSKWRKRNGKNKEIKT